MKRIKILNAGLIVLFLSCSPGKQVAQPATALYGTHWSLSKIHTATGTEDVQTKAFIKFDQEKKTAGGNGSCNVFGSNAAVNNNEVKFTNIFSTKMYCEGVQKTEDAFLKDLEKVTRYEIIVKKLLLYNGDKLLLEFITD